MAAKKQFYKKVLWLEYFTIIWNVAEGIISMTIGIMSGSISIFAFGLESGVEVFSSSVTVWELKRAGNGRRKSALKMISIALIVVGTYVAINAVENFLDGHRAKPTVFGIVAMALITTIMFTVGTLKKRLGSKMKNPVILAEANFTLLDSALSGSILLGLVLNASLGWWWTDQFLALVVAGNAFREGLKGMIASSKDNLTLSLDNVKK